jgi:hypothetical protein
MAAFDGLEGVRERLRGEVRVLVDFLRVMREQANFHSSDAMCLGADSARAAAEMAVRRLPRIDAAGPNWLREMEKTLLCELARAVNLSATVLGEADAEAWPDLAAVADGALGLLGAAADADPSLLAPAEFDLAAFGEGEEAPFSDPPGWRRYGQRGYAALCERGVPAAVLPWSQGAEKGWIAQVCGVAVSFHASPEAAAGAAAGLHRAWFGARAD